MPSTFFAGHTAQIAFLIYCCTLNHSLSQPLDQLALQQQARLEKAVERLKILRQEIYEQQIPFGQTLEDLQKEAASLRGQLREERNLLLDNTDKYVVIDYPHPSEEVKQAWLTYRQELRDLPATATPQLDENENLTNVTWPTPPS